MCFNWLLMLILWLFWLLLYLFYMTYDVYKARRPRPLCYSLLITSMICDSCRTVLILCEAMRVKFFFLGFLSWIRFLLARSQPSNFWSSFFHALQSPNYFLVKQLSANQLDVEKWPHQHQYLICYFVKKAHFLLYFGFFRQLSSVGLPLIAYS